MSKLGLEANCPVATVYSERRARGAAVKLTFTEH